MSIDPSINSGAAAQNAGGLSSAHPLGGVSSTSTGGGGSGSGLYPPLSHRPHHNSLGTRELKLEVATGPMAAPADIAYRDRSPEARAARRRVMLRACVGELVGTCLYFFSVCATVVNLNRIPNVDQAVMILGVAFVAGLALIAMAYSFCDVSGAHFNPAVTFATWLSGMTSNRKSALFVVSQISGGVLAMCLIMMCFPGGLDLMDTLTIVPEDDVANGRVFFTEFMLTFVLVFTIFTVAFETVEDRKKQLNKIKGFSNSRGLTLYTANATSKVNRRSSSPPHTTTLTYFDSSTERDVGF